MTDRIYFDNSATTPLDPRVVRAMLPFLENNFGNPSSLHAEGRLTRSAIQDARLQVANLLGAQAQEIIFTASGTEADNMALFGVLGVHTGEPSHIITSAIEHPAILETCRYLETRGVHIEYLPVDGDGRVHPDDLRRALRPNTRLVSVMTANNVVGTLQPIAELSRITHDHGALFHTDAVQAVGKVPLNVRDLQIDLLSLAGHKLHGPKGIGALYVRTGVELTPLVHGGGQERGLRSATENVAGIVGLGAAAEIARGELEPERARLDALRDELIARVEQKVEEVYLIGHRQERLPGHVCLGLRGLEHESARVMFELDREGIAISTGSACSAHHGAEPSYILRAMGFDDERAAGSLRITLGRFNTHADVERFVEVLPQVVHRVRTANRRYALSRAQGVPAL